MKQVKAQAKFVRGSARKARIVADSVRGMKALYALDVLKYMRKGAAPKVRKVLQSAVANAGHNDNMNLANLVVSQIFIDDAPMFKRGRAESKGRFRRILKRNSHITVVLTDPNATEDSKAAAKKEVVKVVEAPKTKEKSVKAETKPAKAAKTTTKKAPAKKAAAKK